MSKPDPEALTICEAYESLSGKRADGKYYPYKASGDSSEKLTIGRGHLLTLEEKKGYLAGTHRFAKGLTIEEVDDLYAQDVSARWATVDSRIKGTPRQKGTFLSIYFNCPDILTGSPAILHNKGEYVKAATRMLLYRVGSGKPLRGLWRRRMVEALFYLTGEILLVNDKPPAWPTLSLLEVKIVDRLTKLGVAVRDPEIWPKALY